MVCREYCGISWGKALDATGVPVDFELRWLESIYYDPEICELLGPEIWELPGPDSSHPEQAPPASEQPLMDQAPPASLEAFKESDQNGGRGKKAEDLQGISKDQGKKITFFYPKEKAPSAATS